MVNTTRGLLRVVAGVTLSLVFGYYRNCAVQLTCDALALSSPVRSKKRTSKNTSRTKKRGTRASGPSSSAASSSSSFSTSLLPELQRCVDASDVLDRVCRIATTSNDPDGAASCTALVRLSKMALFASSDAAASDHDHDDVNVSRAVWDDDRLRPVLEVLAATPRRSNAVEGLKAAVVLARCATTTTDGDVSRARCLGALEPLARSFHEDGSSTSLQPHELSGLMWAFDTLRLLRDSATKTTTTKTDDDPWPHCATAPVSVREAYDDLRLPFRVRPGALSSSASTSTSTSWLTVGALLNEVSFRRETIVTSTGESVQERRLTAWQEDVAQGASPTDDDDDDRDDQGFAYAGKIMRIEPLSPTVRRTRDLLARGDNDDDDQRAVRYDGCLLNLYPNGESGMRYHSDPDQGTLWTTDTAVVSVGSGRQMAFRATPSNIDGASSSTRTKAGGGGGDGGDGDQPHTFFVMNGDVTEMFGDCQETYQHCVRTIPAPLRAAKRGEGSTAATERRENNDDAMMMEDPRISLVFKKRVVNSITQ